MKKLFILVVALMPLLATSNFPEAKADDDGKVVKNVKKCFGVKPGKVTADMYFNKKAYKGRNCKKVRNHHRNMPFRETATQQEVCKMETVMVKQDHAHTLYEKIKNDSRFPNH